MDYGELVLGFPILYLNGMRIMMFQLSGFYYRARGSIKIWVFVQGPLQVKFKRDSLMLPREKSFQHPKSRNRPEIEAIGLIHCRVPLPIVDIGLLWVLAGCG